MSGFDLQIEVFQHGLAFDIGEIDVVKMDITLDLLGYEFRLPFVHLVRCIHDLKDAFSTGQGGQNAGVLIGDLINGTGDLFGISENGLDITDTDVDQLHRVNNEQTSKGGDQQILQVTDQVHAGAHNSAEDS